MTWHIATKELSKVKAKLLDVSEYMKQGNDNRWKYLKEGYKDHYHLIDGKALPLWIIETVRKRYNQVKSDSFHFQDFIQEHTTYFRVLG